MRFILKVIFLFIIIVLAYTLFLKMYPVKASYYSYLQENQIRAEDFHFGNQTHDIIIVGSSMSEGLMLPGLSKRTTTLNFIGGGSLTGLALIKKKKKLPKAIILETNWLERPLDENLIRPALNPIYSSFLNYLPFLQEKNHPINVLTGQLSSETHTINFNEAMRYVSYNMSRNVEFENKYVDTLQIKESAEKIKRYIDYFERHGVKIYMMELPVHPKMRSTKRNIETKRFVELYFKKVSRIPPYPNLNALQTYDGNHLVESSREKYSTFLTNFLIKNKNDWDHNF
ncbi:hypothetical protein OC25_07130 [Pedobacter kyungheensis]|uniref:SGNH hydrolase-type esterase domain-containing protein n=1 Tax=Pedobacter kyungheensis TaxID=1069985 RepID=A0A0C1DC21_9SPHI|nr:hypothetical protein [Pedobacter kyungheensis]KIA95106.1 hypothetical protein OC25_07130 [Pedobacter kyungheensis]